MIKVTYFMEVTSSWCYWAEPAWARIKTLYEGRAVFDWKIALLDAHSLPVSREQLEWFYRRSGTLVRSPFMLNSGWYEQGVSEYLAPNLVAEAARDLGASGDEVRLAIAKAGLREGARVNELNVVAAIGAKAANIAESELKARAQAPSVEEKVRSSTAQFHALQVSQRPTFVIENGIGDKAVLSGTWKAKPLVGAIESQLADEAAYSAWAVHQGAPPPG